LPTALLTRPAVMLLALAARERVQAGWVLTCVGSL
jgi:hypothetical protein